MVRATNAAWVLVLALVLAGVTAGSAGAAAKPRVKVTEKPGTVAPGAAYEVSGQVSGRLVGSIRQHRVVLEERVKRAWVKRTSGRLGRRAKFTLRWRVRAGERTRRMRIAVLDSRRVVAKSAGWQVKVVRGSEGKACPSEADEEQNSVATLYNESDDETYTTFACWRATGRRTALVTGYDTGSSTDGPAAQVWLRGQYAALNVPSCTQVGHGEFDCTSQFILVDVQTGETRMRFGLGSPIGDVVVTARGTVALIHRREVISATGDERRVLGTEADEGSLAYAERAERLYWTTAGEPHSASLQ